MSGREYELMGGVYSRTIVCYKMLFIKLYKFLCSIRWIAKFSILPNIADMNLPVSYSRVFAQTSETLEQLLNRASLARRLAEAIADDPMGLQLEQIAKDLDAEIDRQILIITGSDCKIQTMPSMTYSPPRLLRERYDSQQRSGSLISDVAIRVRRCQAFASARHSPLMEPMIQASASGGRKPQIGLAQEGDVVFHCGESAE